MNQLVDDDNIIMNVIRPNKSRLTLTDTRVHEGNQSKREHFSQNLVNYVTKDNRSEINYSFRTINPRDKN